MIIPNMEIISYFVCTAIKYLEYVVYINSCDLGGEIYSCLH
jgi:hypothetical protein